MHELSIASSIVEGVLNFAELHRVTKVLTVRLAVGELTCVETEQLRFCYTAVVQETALEASALEIDRVEARVACRHCGYQGLPKYYALFETRVPTLQCPECARAAEATQGHECAIRNIQYVA